MSGSRYLTRSTVNRIVRTITASNATNAIVHNCDKKRFELHLKHGTGLVEYSVKDPCVFDLHHTVIPEAYRGKGVGKVLAKEVLDYCVNSNQKVILTCEFLQNYYSQNPLDSYQRIVVDST